MNKVFAVILIALMPLAFGQSIKKIDTTCRIKEVKIMGIGPEQMIHIVYSYDLKGRLSKIINPENMNEAKICDREYDRNGKLFKEIYSNEGGEVISSKKIEYEKGVKTLETIFDREGKAKGSIKYYYNGRGQLKAICSARGSNWLSPDIADSVFSATLNYYNTDGKMSGRQIFLNGELDSYCEVIETKDKAGSAIAVSYYTPAGECTALKTQLYNERDELATIILKAYSKGRCDINTMNLDYDNSGNMVKIRFYKDDMKLIQTFIIEWEKGKFDIATFEHILDNLPGW